MKLNLVTLLVAATLASSAIGPRAWGQDGVGRSECTQPIGGPRALRESDSRSVADGCASYANRERGAGAARAHFFSGRAYLAGRNYPAAIEQLQLAASPGAWPNSGRDNPFEVRIAKLTLARAYRLSGRFSEARAELRDRNFVSTGEPAAALELALLTLAQSGRDRAAEREAFDAINTVFNQDQRTLEGQLTQGVDPRTYQADTETIRLGRSLLFGLGVDLAKGLQNAPPRETVDQRLSRAEDAVLYLRRATEAAGHARDNGGLVGVEPVFPTPPGPQEIEDAYRSLGLFQLRAAGVMDDRDLAAAGLQRSLDCIGGARSPSASSYLTGAAATFLAISALPDALADAKWGEGCTYLAGLRDDAESRRNSLNRAIQALTIAADATPRDVDTQVTLGRALLMQNATAPNAAAVQRFQSALGALGGALPADALRERDCSESPRARRQAASGAADAQRRLRAQIITELARALYLTAPPSGFVEDPSRTFRRAIEEVDRVSALESLKSATGALEAALSEDSTNVEARLILGHVRIREGNPACAARVLGPLNSIGNDAEGYGEGQYLLSRSLTAPAQQRLAAGAAVQQYGWRQEPPALTYAARAVTSNRANAAFRRQACLSQLIFGHTGDSQYCSASGGQSAEALLYEGMYLLRRGEENSGRARYESWSLALQSFRRGADNVDLNEEHEGLNLQALMRYGERYVQQCAHLTSETERSGDDITAFFRKSGMPQLCGT